MSVSQEEVERRLGHFRDVCRRAAMKLTHQRLEIFRELARTDEHPDAEMVYKGVRKRVPTVSLDTVYRTLWLLLDLGLITTLGFPRQRIRFDANMSSHHHFVCTRCGMVRDFHGPEFDAYTIPEAAKAYGSVERTLVEVRGLCSHCLTTKGE